MIDWIDVNKELPKEDGVSCICWVTKKSLGNIGAVFTLFYFEGIGFCIDPVIEKDHSLRFENRDRGVTHWIRAEAPNE